MWHGMATVSREIHCVVRVCISRLCRGCASSTPILCASMYLLAAPKLWSTHPEHTHRSMLARCVASGTLMLTSLSSLPGRLRAGSSALGLLVAAITTNRPPPGCCCCCSVLPPCAAAATVGAQTAAAAAAAVRPAVAAPSSSVSSCATTRASCWLPPPPPPPLLGHRASTSSRNTITSCPAAASASAASKVSRKRRSDSPRKALNTEPGVTVCSTAPNSSVVGSGGSGCWLRDMICGKGWWSKTQEVALSGSSNTGHRKRHRGCSAQLSQHMRFINVQQVRWVPIGRLTILPPP